MASQWVINNKKVKDWTIGGKKVKSLTLANGKVINFITIQPSAPQTIKSTEYNNISQTRYIDNGKDVSSLQFNYLTGDSAKVFDTLHASTEPSNPTEISGKLIIETGINVLSFTNVDYIRFSYEDTVSNTFKYLKYTPPKQLTFEMRGGRKYQFETNVLPLDLSTEEFKNEIDALSWTSLSHTSYAVVNDEIGYSSIIGAPSLPQDVTARPQNGSVSSSGVVSVPILFSKGNINYMKTVSVDFKIKIISTEINSLNWHNLTYVNDGSINQNLVVYNDIIGKQTLPPDIEATSITNDQILSSGPYDVHITFRYTTNHLSTYTKTVSIMFTINPPKAQIIKATDYTSIAYAGGGITITGGTPTTAWSSVSSSSYAQLTKVISIEVKNDVDCTTRMPYFDWGGTGFTYNAGMNFTLQSGHKYMFENGSIPTDLGEYGTTTPPAPTGPIVKATEYVNDIVASAGYSIRVQNIQNDYFKHITTAGSTETVSFDIEIRCAAPLVFNGISTFRITDIVNRNHLDVRVETGTFTLQNGHKYHIEPGKDPVDLGTY